VDDEGSVGQLLKDRLRDLRLDAALQGQPVAIAETAGPKDLEGDDLKHWMRESRLDAVLQQRPAIETGAPSETGSVVDHIDGADVKHWQRDLRLDAVLHGQPEIGGVPETVAPEGEGTDLKVALREQRLERLFRNPTVSHAGNEVEPVSEGIDVGANLRAQRVNAILGIRDSV
jgi:hypothetical protein